MSVPCPFLLSHSSFPFPPSLPFPPPCRKAAPIPSLSFLYSRPFPPLLPLPSFPFPPSCREAAPRPLPPLPLFPSPSSLPLPFPLSPSLLHLRWLTVFCRVGCILCAVETSRISVADRFGGWQQLIANDIPLLTAIPFTRGP